MGFNIPEKFQSRKFIVAVITALAVILGIGNGVQEQIIQLAMAYIGGQGIVDAAGAWRKK